MSHGLLEQDRYWGGGRAGIGMRSVGRSGEGRERWEWGRSGGGREDREKTETATGRQGSRGTHMQRERKGETTAQPEPQKAGLEEKREVGNRKREADRH